jgi:hypothetical protein
MLTDAEVIAAIRADHLRANIAVPIYTRHYWDEATVDPGGSIFGPGPYVKLPVDMLIQAGSDATERVVIRVYAPERLRRRLAKSWRAEAS